MLLAVLSEVLVMFVDMKFLTLVPVLFFSLALGFHICDRVYIVPGNDKPHIRHERERCNTLVGYTAVRAQRYKRCSSNNAAFSDRNKAVAKA